VRKKIHHVCPEAFLKFAELIAIPDKHAENAAEVLYSATDLKISNRNCIWPRKSILQ
jgi:hypothetical protein